MVISPQHFSELTNGYEQTTSGLWTHRGNARIVGALNFGPPDTSNSVIYGYPIDDPKTPGQQLVAINALTITPGTLHTAGLTVNGPASFQAGTIAGAALADGSVTTAKLAANAVQQLIGSYTQAIAFSVPTANVWTETPIQVNATCSGAQVRIEFNVMIGCPIKGQRIFWSIMVDGNAPPVAVGALDAPEAGYGSMASGTYYLTPSAIAHRFSFGMFGPSGSVVSNAFASTLFITEQKR